MGKLNTVLIMAGGTGGHIYPGLAVATALSAKGVAVHWLGTHQGLEAKVVPDAGLPLHFITISGLRGKGLRASLAMPFKLLKAIRQAYTILKKIKPDVVIGMGGFASGPGGIAAYLLGIPLMIHEQNAKAGLTNKSLATLATKVLAGFPGAFRASKKVVVIGNPVRASLFELPAPAERFVETDQALRLLVLGGSLGATVINQRIAEALSQMAPDERPEVYHQTGEKHVEQARAAYAALGITATIVPFIGDMKAAYAWANVVVCRAGALTIAELCAVGLGSLLVPYPHAVDDHQTANANFLVGSGAARLIQQVDLTPGALVQWIREYTSHAKERLKMAEAAYALRLPDATTKVVEFCEEIAR